MNTYYLIPALLILYADFTCSKVHYITPSLDDPCPHNFSCHTLSQLGDDNDTDGISLLFLPGNHTLNEELQIANADNVLLTNHGQDDDTVYIHCPSRWGRFDISNSNSATIKHLHFIGCGSNRVSNLKQLTIMDSTFQQVTEGKTVLTLTIVTGMIVRCSFLQNTLPYFHSNITKRQTTDYIHSYRNIPNGIMYIAFSNVSINSTNFEHNRAIKGGALKTYYSFIFLSKNTYNNNSAYFGGVMFSYGSPVTIDNSTFANNVAQVSGGVIMTCNVTFTITRSTFINNSADEFGGVMQTSCFSTINVNNCNFSNNSASISGGVMEATEFTKFKVNNSSFAKNYATSGGVLETKQFKGFISMNNSTFFRNNASYGGVMISSDHSLVVVNNCTFNHNGGNGSGIMEIYGNSSFLINNSSFNHNSVTREGGVIVTNSQSSVTINNCSFAYNNASRSGVLRNSNGSSFDIINCRFTHNTGSHGGIMRIYSSIFNISRSIFVNNSATNNGAVIKCTGGTLHIDKSNFSSNAVFNQRGGIIFLRECFTHITDSTFDNNNGSVYTFYSNLILGGHTTFVHCKEPNLKLARDEITGQEGGAITSFQSTVVFDKESILLLSHNQASHGGAILATESTITIYGNTRIYNNMAIEGGGIFLKQSHLEIRQICNVSMNHAVKGGGIHVRSSTVAVYQSGLLHVISNNAQFGGGLYLEVNPKLYILKRTPMFRSNNKDLMTITSNHANYGGAIYVADDTNFGACSLGFECFIQTLSLYYYNVNITLCTNNILLTTNTASDQGSNIFGGLLDRCSPSIFAEVYQKQIVYYSGVNYLNNISNIRLLDSISSRPVRICFCNNEQQPDCDYHPPIIRVEKGRDFNVSLVAVDQVNHSVNAYIVSASDGGFGEGQQIQSVERNCTNLTFNLFSLHDFETIRLYPKGPCASATFSTRQLTVKFQNCTCPIGFEPYSYSQSLTKCECVCDSALSPYITKCNVTTSSVLRMGTNSWISYINYTDPTGFVVYPTCPSDYCQPLTRNVTINFNLPHGSDSQCAYNRTGLLCGACKDNLSLSLASSRCVPCNTYWPAVFAVIILIASIAGILLVTALLALNITVSVGLINGLIFYANIVSAGRGVFFPSTESTFPSVFIAWINLDIGIDICFIDGLDAYIKTWFQLFFPIYIISLVVIVIIVSEYSTRFARLIGKRDPVSTLATLILLSYAKLLSLTITALSSAVLHYPDGKEETVWRPDANVLFLRGKHIPLFLVALLIIIFGLPYTILLFLWQWIVRAPRWKVFKWTRNSKLNAFIMSYHVPHNSKHRYWTGLLLVVRVVLYITASVTVSENPDALPLITNSLVGTIFLLKCVFGVRVYTSLFVDVIDTLLYFNLLLLSAFTQYDFKTNFMKQTVAAYASTAITLILFIGALFYHVFTLIRKTIPPRDLNAIEHLLTSVEPHEEEVTHSYIELPRRDHQHPLLSTSDNNDDDVGNIIEYRETVPPPLCYTQSASY